MAEPITDVPAEVPAGSEEPQAPAPVETPADNNPNSEEPPVVTDTEEEEPALPADNPEAPADEDLSDYWSKKGIDITTPEGQAKAAKSYREAEKAMHEKGQRASELAKSITDTVTIDPDASKADQAMAIATNLQNAEIIRAWKEENNITKAEDVALGIYVKENPDVGELLTAGRITLNQMRAMAQTSVPKPVDTAKIKKEGAQEALNNLAAKQIATSPSGGASTPTAPTKTGDSLAELEERLSDVKF